MKRILISLAASLLVGGASYAGDACAKPETCGPTEICGSPDCCGRCGYKGCCEKHCKIVCEMKEVKKHVWEVKCEEFCPLLPSCGRDSCCDNCGQKCAEGEVCCGDCKEKSCDPCAGENEKADRMKTPTCGKMRVKKTLVKKEVICKAPSYKCVVVYSCANCGAQECNGESVSPAPAKPTAPRAPAPAPAPPKTTQTAPLPPVAGASFVK